MRAFLFFTFFLFPVFPSHGYTGEVAIRTETRGKELILILENGKLGLSVALEGDRLVSESLMLKRGFARKHHGQPFGLVSDGDFRLDLFWTDWRFPGHDNNGDNQVSLNKTHFAYERHEAVQGDGAQWDLFFKGQGHPLELKISYRLGPDDFFVRRRVTVRDTRHGGHFLDTAYARHGAFRIQTDDRSNGETVAVKVEGSADYTRVRSGRKQLPATSLRLVKAGSFGQPAALAFGAAGAFFGLEYPASINNMNFTAEDLLFLSCSQEMGELVGKIWLGTEWVVWGMTPNHHVKNWFFSYLDSIRVAPLRPYTLYNSWYDLRSVEYPKVPASNHMNESNVLRMVQLVRENMIEKHGIKMDAFVLDDGWDIYDSDWQLREKQFPRGMKPIAEKLRETGTDLGIWLGPTGGYSFKMRRLKWMAEHQYEIIRDYEMSYRHSMLCLGGEHYGRRFKERVVDFTANHQVGFFKWDGIQFACSDPGHGHPVGKYSRRAVLETLIDICAAVRTKNPDIFLNITSGTWLSPWWLKYTNQIWMDGQDYAFADVPSISKRDNAMTYRDFVLYDDFRNKDLWFPIANLMTHGIIKGKLDHIGGSREPIDKFTDNALLYFARGVSMWELYISPDMLTQPEWEAMSLALNWARERFDLLKKTVMVGGDPMRREPYGYAHYSGAEGILALRNPYIQKREISLKLDPAHGLDPRASNLVLERVYPTRRIAPRLFAAGALLSLPLDGYQTAVYQLYPLEKARKALVAGVDFEEEAHGSAYRIHHYGGKAQARILNPEVVRSMKRNRAAVALADLDLTGVGEDRFPQVSAEQRTREIRIRFTLPEQCRQVRPALLLRGDTAAPNREFPLLEAEIDGRSVEARIRKQKGKWIWYTLESRPGSHQVVLKLAPRGERPWHGRAEVWLTWLEQRSGETLEFELKSHVLPGAPPPRPWRKGERRRQVKIRAFSIPWRDSPESRNPRIP